MLQLKPGSEKVLSNPYVKSDDKKRVLLAAAGENPGDDFRRFVTLIIDHRREEFAYSWLVPAYRDIYRKENKYLAGEDNHGSGTPRRRMG